MANKMAQGCGLNLAILYEKNKNNTGFKYVCYQDYNATIGTLYCFIIDTAVFVRWSCVVW